MANLRRGNNRPLALGQRLGAGGEAAVFAVAGEPNLVAKLYHRPTALHAAKLRAMIANPPTEPTRVAGHRSFAWPAELILDEHATVVGFLMPRINFAKSVPLLKLYNPHDRQRTEPAFTWDYLLQTARNIATVVEMLHLHGYVIGDLNESNLLVTNQALVTLIDCDSLQVPAGAAAPFRCLVGKAEYTPPEVQAQDFASLIRRPSGDNFGLAILTFMLLMEGVHPFAGVWLGGGPPPTTEENIKHCNSPYTRPKLLTPPPYAPPFTTLPPEVQAFMLRCFGTGCTTPDQRPTAQEWHLALRTAAQLLIHCRVNPRHVYSAHLRQCPWCQLTRRGIPDPFPASGSRRPLPPPVRIPERRNPRLGPMRVQAPAPMQTAVRTRVRPLRRRRFSFIATFCALLSGLGVLISLAAQDGRIAPAESAGLLGMVLVTLIASMFLRPLVVRYSSFGIAAALSVVELWRVLQQGGGISRPAIGLGLSACASLAGFRSTWGRLPSREQVWARRAVLAAITLCSLAFLLYSNSLGL